MGGGLRRVMMQYPLLSRPLQRRPIQQVDQVGHVRRQKNLQERDVGNLVVAEGVSSHQKRRRRSRDLCDLCDQRTRVVLVSWRTGLDRGGLRKTKAQRAVRERERERERDR